MPEVTISQVMEAYAKDAEEHARQNGVTLDYSEASLLAVDGILSKFTGDGVITLRTPEEEEAAWQLAKMYGGYIGQVVIKEIGGGWEAQDQPDGSLRVVLRSCKVQMFPPEKVFKRLTQDRFSGVAGYCRAIRKIIEMREQQNRDDR